MQNFQQQYPFKVIKPKKKKKCLVSGNMKRFSWVGRSDLLSFLFMFFFFLRQVNTFFFQS